MFLLFEQVNEPILFNNGRFCIDEAGLYCLVECLDDPFSTLELDNTIREKRSKEARVNVRGWGERERISGKCLYLVLVECIHGPVAAVPNIGAGPGDFILVRPFNTWSKGFTSCLNGDL